MAIPNSWLRIGWWALVPCAVAGAVGLAVHTSILRLALVSMFSVIFIAVGCGGWAVFELNSQPSWRGILLVLRRGLAYFWAALGVGYLVAWAPWLLVGPAGIAGVAAAMWALRRRRAQRNMWQAAEAVMLEEAGPRIVRGSSDDQLCRFWRVTEQELREADQPSTLRSLAELRSLILDEFAGRNPEGFARWLADRPDSTAPDPYLTRRR